MNFHTEITLRCYSVIKIITKCHDCDKNYLSMSDLLVHIKITHQKCSILRYKFEKNCEHCGKDVTEKGNCKKHIHT